MNAPSASIETSGAKLVIMIGAFIRGGCERQAFLLSRELRRAHGVNAEVWALSGDRYDAAYAGEFEAAGVPTGVLGFLRPTRPPLRIQRIAQWGSELRRVQRRLRAGRIDVLLPFTTWPNVACGLTYRLAGVRLCIWGERHAGGERVPTPERLAVRQYPHFVANSTAGVDFLAHEMKVSRGKISLVPNGVEPPKAGRLVDWRAKLGLTSGQLLLVKVANLSSFKDHMTLLRAWRLVQESWTGADRPVLALAGQHDDTYAECEQFVRDACLQSSVRFLGGVPGVTDLLLASDLGAFSSRKEGMPNGVLECMAAGKAIVASDLPGVRDALGPGCTDVLVAPGDAAGFACKLADMLGNGEKRAAMGERNAARIRSEFAVERMAERHLDVIRANLPASRQSRWRSPQLSQA
jgi:glycosyltransferase involved in cell wall biosynthesis